MKISTFRKITTRPQAGTNNEMNHINLNNITMNGSKIIGLFLIIRKKFINLVGF